MFPVVPFISYALAKCTYTHVSCTGGSNVIWVMVSVLVYVPLCVGDWKPTQIDNPDYQGEWVHPKIPNPEYEADEFLYRYEDFGVIGLDLWQVKRLFSLFPFLSLSLSLSPPPSSPLPPSSPFSFSQLFSQSNFPHLSFKQVPLFYSGQIWHHL